MSSADQTKLTSNNTNAVKACVMEIKGKCTDWLLDVKYREGDIECLVLTYRCVPSEIIKKVSQQFPNDVITCDYSFENNGYSEIYTFEYSHGDEKEVDIKPGYFYKPIPLNNEIERDAILEKAISFCRKLDTTKKDKDGTLFIDWFNEKVCFTFEHDSKDGKKYRIEATKEFNELRFNVYEGHVKYDWWKISNNAVGADVPF